MRDHTVTPATCLDCTDRPGVRDSDTLCDIHYRRQEACSEISEAVHRALGAGASIADILFEVTVGLAVAQGFRLTTPAGEPVGMTTYVAAAPAPPDDGAREHAADNRPHLRIADLDDTDGAA